ncbi:hypothetical protein PAMP_020624 [Pampus punctatissimus]
MPAECDTVRRGCCAAVYHCNILTAQMDYVQHTDSIPSQSAHAEHALTTSRKEEPIGDA